jgi:rhodanese-related sulfurtransferase
MIRRLYSVQRMTVNQYSKILNSNLRNNYQIVDVREPDELKAVNVSDQNILNLPISQSWKWGGDIARHKTLDPVKPVICVVCLLSLPLSHLSCSVDQEGEV